MFTLVANPTPSLLQHSQNVSLKTFSATPPNSSFRTSMKALISSTQAFGFMSGYTFITSFRAPWSTMRWSRQVHFEILRWTRPIGTILRISFPVRGALTWSKVRPPWTPVTSGGSSSTERTSSTSVTSAHEFFYVRWPDCAPGTSAWQGGLHTSISREHFVSCVLWWVLDTPPGSAPPQDFQALSGHDRVRVRARALRWRGPEAWCAGFAQHRDNVAAGRHLHFADRPDLTGILATRSWLFRDGLSSALQWRRFSILHVRDNRMHDGALRHAFEWIISLGPSVIKWLPPPPYRVNRAHPHLLTKHRSSCNSSETHDSSWRWNLTLHFFLLALSVAPSCFVLVLKSTPNGQRWLQVQHLLLKKILKLPFYQAAWSNDFLASFTGWQLQYVSLKTFSATPPNSSFRTSWKLWSRPRKPSASWADTPPSLRSGILKHWSRQVHFDTGRTGMMV